MSSTAVEFPVWAKREISSIRAMEIKLGNIPASENLHTLNYENVEKILDDDFYDYNSILVDQKFATLIKKLVGFGFSFEKIVEFVNSQISYKGGPKYCNESDLRDCLEALN